MSNDVIRADYEALEKIAARFGDESERVGEMNGRIQSAMRSLQNGGWEGKGAAAFFTEMEGTVSPASTRLMEALAQAQTVTLQIKGILSAAEKEAAAPFQGTGAFGGTANPSLGGEGTTGNGFLGGVKDFFGGMYDEGKDMVTGLWNLVTDPVGTAKGLWHGITHPNELWDAFKQPYVEAWESGHPWQAIGRGTMFIGSMLIGTKGADKAAAGAKASRAARVAQEAGEMGARYGNVVDDVARAAGATVKSSRAETAAARFIADQSTHAYPGALADRVVLGGYAAKPAKGYLGYIGEARAHGGRIFNTGDDVWRIIQPAGKGGNGRIWPVNREFLQAQLERGRRVSNCGEKLSRIFSQTRKIIYSVGN